MLLVSEEDVSGEDHMAHFITDMVALCQEMTKVTLEAPLKGEVMVSMVAHEGIMWIL